jgi:hypothetical protein
MLTSSIALAVAVLWIVSLLTLFIALAGSDLFTTVSLLSSILAGIGMLALVWLIDGSSSDARRTLKLGIGSVGSVTYIAFSALTLVGFRNSDELEPWMIGGLAIYGVWMLLDSAFPSISSERALRRLKAAVGIGFVLLFVSVIFLGAVGTAPQAGRPADTLMFVLQGVGGLVAYLGFPAWLLLVARQARSARV